MAYVDSDARRLHCKIVYWGPALAGRTTNLRYLHSQLRPAASDLICLSTEEERILYFILAAGAHGQIGDLALQFHVCTLPGVVFHEALQRVTLRGVDAIVFVADSQRERLDANLYALAELESRLALDGNDLARLPRVMQYNKRDTPTAMPVAELSAALNRGRAPEIEAMAQVGTGVLATLEQVITGLVAHLREGE